MGNLVVATLVSEMGAHKKIALIDLTEGSIAELAEGDELWHPSLWIKGNLTGDDDVLIDLDSAGAYLTENHIDMLSELRLKMELFWKGLDKTQILLIGSSRIRQGVDPDLYPEWNMLNMGVPGIDPELNMYLAKNYGLTHSENLKAIVLSIDIDHWDASPFLGYVLSSSPGYQYDENHHFWASGIPVGFIEAAANGYPAEPEVKQRFTERAGVYADPRSWDADKIEVLEDSVFTDEEMQYALSQVESLKAFADSAAKKGVYIIGIIFPQAPQYRQTGAFGVYGLQRSSAKEIIAKLDSIGIGNDHFILMDENRMGDHDYNDAMAYNRDHLSSLGAAQLTDRLVNILKKLK